MLVSSFGSAAAEAANIVFTLNVDNLIDPA